MLQSVGFGGLDVNDDGRCAAAPSGLFGLDGTWTLYAEVISGSARILCGAQCIGWNNILQGEAEASVHVSGTSFTGSESEVRVLHPSTDRRLCGLAEVKLTDLGGSTGGCEVKAKPVRGGV